MNIHSVVVFEVLEKKTRLDSMYLLSLYAFYILISHKSSVCQSSAVLVLLVCKYVTRIAVKNWSLIYINCDKDVYKYC